MHRREQDTTYDTTQDSQFAFLQSSEPSWKDFKSFKEIEKSLDIYFSVQSSKLDETQKCYKEYLQKNEVNFCSLAMM